jgi:hypothetical protein
MLLAETVNYLAIFDHYYQIINGAVYSGEKSSSERRNNIFDIRIMSVGIMISKDPRGYRI